MIKTDVLTFGPLMCYSTQDGEVGYMIEVVDAEFARTHARGLWFWRVHAGKNSAILAPLYWERLCNTSMVYPNLVRKSSRLEYLVDTGIAFPGQLENDILCGAVCSAQA